MLAGKIDEVIKKIEARRISEHVYSNKYISSIIKGAEILFKDLGDVLEKTK